jgi:predicted phage tail protein
MKKFLVTSIVVLIAVSLTSSGCKQEAEETSKPAEVAAASAEVKTPEDAVKAGEEAAKIMAAATEGVDTADAPEYLKKIAQHMKGISKVLKDNMDDCAKGVAALNKYLEDNRADIDAMSKTAREAQDKMSDMDKMKIAQQAAALMGPVMQEYGGVQAAFAQKCPKELANIAGALRGLQEASK